MSSTLTPLILRDWFKRSAEIFNTERERLTQLDSDIGDGDHGENIARGFAAVVAKLPAEGDPAFLFKNAAMTLISTVGGASGPLYGSFFLDASKASAGLAEITQEDWVRILEAAVKGVQNRGKAMPGDKTMVDALVPAVDAARDGDLVSALRKSADAAAAGAEATVPMIAKKGRASYLGERSVGHLDPGAVSSQLLLTALVAAAESA
jgi:phosphoenolpyruvate---glycerone phosphotransferase subunit DhaL